MHLAGPEPSPDSMTDQIRQVMTRKSQLSVVPPQLWNSETQSASIIMHLLEVLKMERCGWDFNTTPCLHFAFFSVFKVIFFCIPVMVLCFTFLKKTFDVSSLELDVKAHGKAE